MKVGEDGIPILPEPDPPAIPKLREGLPIERAVDVALVEDFWPDYYAWVKREWVKSRDGRRPQLSAVKAFQKAMDKCGHLADPVRRLLEELGVDSTESLRAMVNGWKMAQRHTEHDRLEMALQTIERHIVHHREAGPGVLERVRTAVGKAGTHAARGGSEGEHERDDAGTRQQEGAPVRKRAPARGGGGKPAGGR